MAAPGECAPASSSKLLGLFGLHVGGIACMASSRNLRRRKIA
jgi:hypothetical protein